MKKYFLYMAATFLMVACTKDRTEEVPVTGVTLNRSAALLLVGDTLTLEAALDMDSASNKTVKWTTSDNRVATVNSSGKVTAVAPGTAMIIAATDDERYKATCTVTVAATGITMATIATSYVEFSISAGTGNIIVDWGDGELYETNNVSSDELVFYHRYSHESEYHITITGNDIVSFKYDNYQFPDLDISTKASLRYDIRYYPLAALDASRNPALKVLSCPSNHISSLDLSQNTELTYLNCSQNYIKSLDMSQSTKLTYLNCNVNPILSLDLSQNTELTYLACSRNPLKTLDVSHNTKLTYLACAFNGLSILDVSRNSNLIELVCNYNNNLTTLDVSHNTSLERLSCSFSGLTTLYVSSNNNALIYLQCVYNYLTASALNDLFMMLPDNSLPKEMYIGDSLGASDCDISIAEKKGWRVYR